MQSLINDTIREEVQGKLDELVSQHQVTIISAIESGSRSWGFPSPDSDYDVRFLYAHSSDWYAQINPERDVIELPVNAVLDIGGWDVRKAMMLANKGNSIIQEWMISPLIYRQNEHLTSLLGSLVARTFNAKASFHHYSAMAQSMMSALNEPDIKLKRFFYISRATLSALWILRKHSMPTVVFKDLLQSLTDDKDVLEAFERQIRDKNTRIEADVGEVEATCLDFLRRAYLEVMSADIGILPSQGYAIDNKDLREFLAMQ